MSQPDILLYKEWFDRYTRLFFLEDPQEQKNIDLKIRHTSEVCSLIVQIAAGLGVDRRMIFLAETAALFHDVGRFSQFKQYKTFRDSISVNHGRLGAEILRQERVLESLPPADRECIIDAVQFHNAFAIPDLKNPEGLTLLKMVRDADKLDIWRIFTGFYEGDPQEVASEAGLGLPDLPECSAEVLARIDRGETALMKDLRSLNDFKLMLMSWVYDLNYNSSLELMAGKDYINRLAELLPQDSGMRRIRDLLSDYTQQRLKG